MHRLHRIQCLLDESTGDLHRLQNFSVLSSSFIARLGNYYALSVVLRKIEIILSVGSDFDNL